MRRVMTLAMGPLLLVGCSGEPAGPDPGLAPDPVAARVPNAGTSEAVAIDDVLDRLLPALDAETATALRGPLVSISNLLKGKRRDPQTVNAAIAVAQAALARPLAASDERAPDLAAIAIALSASARN